jgi:F-type H+-transporting ATPase subunit c
MMLAQAATEAVTQLHGNVGVGIVGAGAAIGIGLAGMGGAMATGRNPGAFGKIFTTALLGMALAEGLAMLVYFLPMLNK